MIIILSSHGKCTGIIRVFLKTVESFPLSTEDKVERLILENFAAKLTEAPRTIFKSKIVEISEDTGRTLAFYEQLKRDKFNVGTLSQTFR